MRTPLVVLVMSLLIFASLVKSKSQESTCTWQRCGKRTLENQVAELINCEPEESGTADQLTQVVSDTRAGAVTWQCLPK